MADKTKVLFKMGNKDNLPTAETGSLIIAKDTKELFADTPEDGRIQVGLTEEEAHANNLFQIEKDEFSGGTWYCWPWRDQMQTQLTLEFTDATEQELGSDWAPALTTTYFIYINDVEYRNIAYSSQDQKIQYLGNGELLDSSYKKSPTPFVIWWDNDARISKIKFKEAFTGKIVIKQNIYSAYIVLPDVVQLGSGGHVVSGDCPTVVLSNSIFQLSPFFEIHMRKELNINKLIVGSNLHAVYVPDPLEEDPTGQGVFNAGELQTQMVNKRYVDNIKVDLQDEMAKIGEAATDAGIDFEQHPNVTFEGLTEKLTTAYRLVGDVFIMKIAGTTNFEATAGSEINIGISLDDYDIKEVLQTVSSGNSYIQQSLNNYTTFINSTTAKTGVNIKLTILQDVAAGQPLNISLICKVGTHEA